MLPENIPCVKVSLQLMGENSAGHIDPGVADFRIIEEENELGHHLHLVGNFSIVTPISA